MHLGRFTQITSGALRLSRRATLRAAGAAPFAAIVGTERSFSTEAAPAATPAASPTSSGFTTELLAAGVPSTVPGQALQLIRLTFAPGVTHAAHQRPGTRVVYVDAGVLALTVVQGHVAHEPAGGNRLTDQKILAPGTEYTLHVGDSLFVDGAAVTIARSAGPEPLVLWEAALSPENNLITNATPVAAPAASPAA